MKRTGETISWVGQRGKGEGGSHMLSNHIWCIISLNRMPTRIWPIVFIFHTSSFKQSSFRNVCPNYGRSISCQNRVALLLKRLIVTLNKKSAITYLDTPCEAHSWLFLDTARILKEHLQLIPTHRKFWMSWWGFKPFQTISGLVYEVRSIVDKTRQFCL